MPWLGTARAILAIVLATTLPTPTHADVGRCIETLAPPASVAALKPADVLLAITAPRAGESIARHSPNDSVTVSADYWGPRLVPADAARAIDNNHLVYLLDQDASPYVGTLQPLPICDQHIVHTDATRATFDNVRHGSHVLVVLLVGSNNVSVQPPVAASITFTVT